MEEESPKKQKVAQKEDKMEIELNENEKDKGNESEDKSEDDKIILNQIKTEHLSKPEILNF